MPVKPELQTIQYYDWDSALEYVLEKHGLVDENPDEDGEYYDVWGWICDNMMVSSGATFELNWGTTSEPWIDLIFEKLAEEFGKDASYMTEW